MKFVKVGICLWSGGWMILLAASSTFGGIRPVDLRCESKLDPLGLGETSPRLSWQEVATLPGERGQYQTAYQIQVASSLQVLTNNQGDLWDTGQMATNQTSQIAYAGSALKTDQVCYWHVQVWDRNGQPSGWSFPASWTMGILTAGEWSAQWISAGTPSTNPAARLVIRQATYEANDGGGTADVTATLVHRVEDDRLVMPVNNTTLGVDPARDHIKQLRVDYEFDGRDYTDKVRENEILTIPKNAAVLPYLRKDFDLAKRVQRAVLHVTALGLYEVDINGHRVGDHVLAPDWTDYRKRVRYQAYDVTAFLTQGDNAIGALLANGWYSGHIGNGGFQFFGRMPAFLAQLEVTYDDGSTKTIVTDSSWKSYPSPILSSDFMMGEDYDARREVKGWDQPGLSETGWVPVTMPVEPSLLLQDQVSQPVRELCELKPRKITEPEPGHWIFDLGQNMVGVVRLNVSAPAGTEVTIRQGEMLNPDGTLYTRNLRGASSIDHYVCNGEGVEVWQPRFTFHGFRYVEITGLSGRPSKDVVTGIVIGSDTPRTGEFACSDVRINQLQSNIQWGQRGNYISIPTDCPQRDERLGWMGDAEVFIRTATYNADVAAFFTKWLVDVDDGQSPPGAFSNVSPNTSQDVGGVPAWGDAGVICPWTIYQMYGDRRILERHLPAMIKWVDYMQLHSDGLIRDKDRGEDFGDWLSINADTPKDLIGTAFFAYSTHLLARACRVLGREAEADKYDQLFADIKTAFNERYVAADGRIQGNTQCAYAMALKFELLPENLRPKAAQYLAEDIKAKGGHLSTGFVGVSYLLPVLTQAGKVDTAYGLLLQDTFPSWLFSVKYGATTIWERWDGWTPEKGFQNPGMNSFNHYALGSCGEYLFGYIGGIRPASPGFKTILIDPVIRDGLTWASTSFDSVHGRIGTAWKVEGKRLTLEVTVPVNTAATVCIPAGNIGSITETGKPVEQAEEVKFLRRENDKAVFEVGSGNYKFTSEIGQ
jgi:alpha-L-rhamnosidase